MSRSSLQRIDIALLIAAFPVVLVIVALGRANRLSENSGAWGVLAFGVLLSIHVAWDIRRGRTRDPSDRYQVDSDDFLRSAPHPSVFWIVIGLKGAVAAFMTLAPLGAMLGLWKF